MGLGVQLMMLRGIDTAAEMRAIVLMNAKLKKYIHVHKRTMSIEKITFSPTEISNINQDADSMYAMLDVNKVLYTNMNMNMNTEAFYFSPSLTVLSGQTSIKS